jgi:uncharacterized membrane protein YtjA (UPF0391 family)
MGEFVHAFILGSIAYLVLSLRFKGEFSWSWKIILTVFIAFFCIMMLRSGQYGIGALLRTTGCASAFVIIGILHYCLKGRTEPDTIILQCPRCLEVQPKSEACIKCGLNLRKCKASEPSNSASTDDETERMDPGIEKFMNNSALIYLLTALVISIFDIGNLEISKFYCEAVKSLIPSLHEASNMSRDPNNTCLILALAWTWPIATGFIMIKRLNEQLANGTVTIILPQGKWLLKFFVILLMIALVAGLLHFIPTATHGSSLKTVIIDKLIRNWAIGSALWGVMIYYAVIFLLIIVISSVMEFIDNRGK